MCNACSDRFVFITQLHGVVIEEELLAIRTSILHRDYPGWPGFRLASYRKVSLPLDIASLFTRSPLVCWCCSCCLHFLFESQPISVYICVFVLEKKKKTRFFLFEKGRGKNKMKRKAVQITQGDFKTPLL